MGLLADTASSLEPLVLAGLATTGSICELSVHSQRAAMLSRLAWQGKRAIAEGCLVASVGVQIRVPRTVIANREIARLADPRTPFTQVAS